MKKQSLLIILIPFIFCYSFSQSEPENINLRSSTGARYVSSDDGVLRMYVNIWGHVKGPGNHLVYDGINLPSFLSILLCNLRSVIAKCSCLRVAIPQLKVLFFRSFSKFSSDNFSPVL